MSTGYTSCIGEGATFEEFALRTACAFFYDTDKLPEKLEVSKYHFGHLEEVENKLAYLKGLDIEIAEEKAKEEYAQNFACKEESIREKTELREKYEAILVKAKAWQIPTPDHKRLKEYMIEQIEGSIQHDCNLKYTLEEEITLLSGRQWLQKELNQALKDIAYHSKEWNKEVAKTEQSNQWIKALRESLEETE